MKRISFLIDGFNLYHSLNDASQFFTGTSLKWLDIKRLCENYISNIGIALKENYKLEKIYYFTSLANHLQKQYPGKILRHKLYIECLNDGGIIDIKGRFKEKNVFCYKCKSNIIKHEEKETDVAISIKMFEILYKKECDAVVIMTGDTDITPAIKTSKVLFSDKKIISCFPFKRNNKELESITDFSFNINKDLYLKFQLPDPYIKKDGTPIYKPFKW
jgi:uncharacterized LabA/DUF88 family protein